MKIIATVESRMASTRLPGKTMLKIMNRPLISLVVERLSLAKMVDEVIVATTTKPDDDVIADFCEKEGVLCYRGSENDVLGRVFEAAKMFNADIIVQAGADCPFYDPKLIDQLIDIYLDNDYNYVANDMELTYPVGVDAHIIPVTVLEEINGLASGKQDREDVPNYIWEHPEKYKIFNLTAPRELNRPDLRLTLDYEEDLELTRKIYEALYPVKPFFTTLDIIELINSHPELKEINAHCKQLTGAYYFYGNDESE